MEDMIILNKLNELQLKELLTGFSRNYLSVIDKNQSVYFRNFIDITGIINNQNFEIHFIFENNHSLNINNIMGISLMDNNSLYYLPVKKPAASILNSKELYLKTSFNLYENYPDILSDNKITLSELK